MRQLSGWTQRLVRLSLRPYLYQSTQNRAWSWQSCQAKVLLPPCDVMAKPSAGRRQVAVAGTAAPKETKPLLTSRAQNKPQSKGGQCRVGGGRWAAQHAPGPGCHSQRCKRGWPASSGWGGCLRCQHTAASGPGHRHFCTGGTVPPPLLTSFRHISPHHISSYFPIFPVPTAFAKLRTSG